MQALIDECARSDSPAEISLVISNVESAAGLERAAEAGIATLVIDHRAYDGREEFEVAMIAALEEAGVELVCLAGFMRLLTEKFVTRWHDRLINIHPSLLPAYRGLDTHERAIRDGVRFGGCTVHFVRPEMDVGPIIIQAAVPIRDGDSADDLAARVLSAEHRCYPWALRQIAEGLVTIEDEIVRIAGSAPPDDLFLNPSDR